MYFREFYDKVIEQCKKHAKKDFEEFQERNRKFLALIDREHKLLVDTVERIESLDEINEKSVKSL